MTLLNRSRLIAGKELVTFLNRCSDLLVEQMTETQKFLEETVVSVMDDIEQLSEVSLKAKEKADQAFTKTYLSPDDQTSEYIDTVQSYVDKVIEGREADDEIDEVETLLNENIVRFAGRFSKHMESLSGFEERLKDPLLAMIGALSVDDKIAQKLQHLTLCTTAFKVMLSYLLVDFDHRANTERAKFLTEDLLSYTWGTYSTDDEREAFLSIFDKG